MVNDDETKWLSLIMGDSAHNSGHGYIIQWGTTSRESLHLKGDTSGSLLVGGHAKEHGSSVRRNDLAIISCLRTGWQNLIGKPKDDRNHPYVEKPGRLFDRFLVVENKGWSITIQKFIQGVPGGGQYIWLWNKGWVEHIANTPSMHGI